MSLDLDQLRMALNLRVIQRFQTHETIKTDHVDRHSFRATAFYDYLGGTEPLAMLWHDIEEALTGDLPSPMKRYLQGLELFEKLRPSFKDPLQKRLGKMCDKLDLVYTLQEQLLSTGTLPPRLFDIFEAEKEMLLDIAKELSLKTQVNKLLRELKKPFDSVDIVERLIDRLDKEAKLNEDNKKGE